MGFNKSDKETESTQCFKKPFNKKKWREQKYSNKAKVQKWDNIKKRQAIRQYHKELKKSGNDFRLNTSKLKTQETKSLNSFKQAQNEYQRLQQEKVEKRKELERIRKERSEALRTYKEKKLMRYKKISQRTRKGQPVMRGRIELLLEKIQREYVNKNNE